jgi:hypothetical protein
MKQLSNLINKKVFTKEQQDIFNQLGVLIIEKLLTSEGVELLIKASKEDVKLSDRSKEFTPSFDLFSNQFITRSDKFRGLLDELSKPISQITGEEIVFTQALLLEMNPGTQGFPWHFDEYSYCFIRPEDTAFSLWIPLIPIHTKNQHGGMNWVNQNDFCAKSRMQQWAYHQKKGLQVESKSRMQQWEHYQKKGSQAEIPCNKYDEAKWEQYGDRWTGEYDLKMLEDLKQEGDMELGDVLFFNRYIWHKTHEIRSGIIPSRTAIVFRMVSADALFDKNLFEKTMALRNKIKVPDSFGHLLAEFDDGISMREAVASGISIFSSTKADI